MEGDLATTEIFPDSIFSEGQPKNSGCTGGGQLSVIKEKGDRDGEDCALLVIKKITENIES